MRINYNVVPFNAPQQSDTLSEISRPFLNQLFIGVQRVYKNGNQPITCQCCPHIEISQLICIGNQLTGFYMRQNWHLTS